MASFRRLAAVLVATAVACTPGDAPRPTAAPTTTASATPSPTLPPVVTRSPAAFAIRPSEATAPTATGVARALAARLRDAALGSRVNAAVVDAATGTTLYASGATQPAIPASTTKLFTGIAALHALGPDRTFETRVVAAGPTAGGVLDGDLVVVGGGDPTLTNDATPESYPAPATLASLARRVRKAGIRRVTGDLVVDASVFDGPGLAPGWKPTYVTEGSVAPIRGFLVDGGRVRIDDDARYGEPDVAGAAKLRVFLRKAGVRIGDTIRRGVAPSTGETVATVTSPPVGALVERMLIRSDNELAESLARHVAIERGLPADFAGVAQAVPATIRELGVTPPTIHDGSGLSRLNRVTPEQLVAVLLAATRQDRYRALLTGLPVAAFSGTLSTRYDKPPARTAAGRVRAKTGSLDNVATLAGTIETATGRVLVFAFTADRLPTRFVGAAARALDAAAAALAACGCR